ncbi:MFS transporter [candidate division KSB1 bacterium]
MAKVIFSVSYEIDPEKRDDYLKLMSEVREQVKKITGQDYTVYEDAHHPNMMSEVFYLESEADYQKVKDFQQDSDIDLINEIDKYLLNQDQVIIRTYQEVI